MHRHWQSRGALLYTHNIRQSAAVGRTDQSCEPVPPDPTEPVRTISRTHHTYPTPLKSQSSHGRDQPAHSPTHPSLPPPFPFPSHSPPHHHRPPTLPNKPQPHLLKINPLNRPPTPNPPLAPTPPTKHLDPPLLIQLEPARPPLEHALARRAPHATRVVARVEGAADRTGRVGVDVGSPGGHKREAAPGAVGEQWWRRTRAAAEEVPG